MSTSDILESLIEKDNGYLITSKAVESGVSKPSVSKYVREHDMEKVAHGIYILDNVWPDELFVLQQRNKNIIYSGETALYLHGLIDREYSHICFTVPTGYNATHIKKKNKEVRYANPDILDMGTCEIPSSSGNLVKVYDKERCICDLIMNSKADQISFDVLKKAFAATCMKRETSFGEEEVRETLDKIKDDSGLEEMWNRFKRVNYFVDDLSWGEVSEIIVDNIEKISFIF